MKNIFWPIIFCLFFACGVLFHARTVSRAVQTSVPYHEFFPEAQEWNKYASPIPYFEVRDARKTLIGYLILTEELALNISGYAGATPLILALNPEGKIINLRALPNQETPSYTSQSRIFLKQFLGASSQKPLQIGQDVDAITHATITSEAMTATIRETLKRFSEGVLDEKSRSVDAPASLDGSKILFPAAIFLLALTALVLKNTFLRWGALLCGFVYFGLITQTMLSIVQIANLGLGHIPAFSGNPLWFMTLLLGLGACLITGRLYCGALCPFAFLQEILSKTIRHPQLPSTPIHHQASSLKYILLFVILGVCFWSGTPAGADMEPFVTLFSAQGTKLAWGLVGLMLVLAIFYHRFWCVYLCPVGALTGLAARISIFQIRARISCTRCGLCISGCPTRAIHLANAKNDPRPGLQAPVRIDSAECILCGKCLARCPGQHLKLTACAHDSQR